jgi:hypothetical protein
MITASFGYTSAAVRGAGPHGMARIEVTAP